MGFEPVGDGEGGVPKQIYLIACMRKQVKNAVMNNKVKELKNSNLIYLNGEYGVTSTPVKMKTPGL